MLNGNIFRKDQPDSTAQKTDRKTSTTSGLINANALQRAIKNPQLLTPSMVNQLQRTHGNQFVCRLIQRQETDDHEESHHKLSEGDPLPDFASMMKERSLDHISPEMVIDMALANLDDSKFQQQVWDNVQAETPSNKPKPTKADLKQGIEMMRKTVRKWIEYQSVAGVVDPLLDILGKSTPAHRIKKEAQRLLLPLVKQYALKHLSHMHSHEGRGSMYGGQLNESNRKRFADALKQMPIFTEFVQSAREGESPEVNTDGTEWKDSGNLKEMLDEEKDGTDEPDMGRFEQMAENVDRFYKQLVQKSILAQIKRPKIFVHWRKETGDNALRAYYKQNTVHLAMDEQEEIMVHEVGHHIEDKLPEEAWQDIKLLLMARHSSTRDSTDKAVGGEEGKFAGNYPETGQYTARAYSDGNSEVMSMTMQFLSQPEKLEALVDSDPIRVAVILRAVRPEDYQKTDALREFDYLLTWTTQGKSNKPIDLFADDETK